MLGAIQEHQLYFNWSTMSVWEKLESSRVREGIYGHAGAEPNWVLVPVQKAWGRESALPRDWATGGMTLMTKAKQFTEHNLHSQSSKLTAVKGAGQQTWDVWGHGLSGMVQLSSSPSILLHNTPRWKAGSAASIDVHHHPPRKDLLIPSTLFHEDNCSWNKLMSIIFKAAQFVV